MSRSVSAPSSVTKTSPCWVGFMVPGSTLRYGSSFWIVTFNPLPSRRLAMDADASPLPSDETTPPVTKMNLVCCFEARIGALTNASDQSRAHGRRAHACNGADRQTQKAAEKKRRSSSTRNAILGASNLEVNGSTADSHH